MRHIFNLAKIIGFAILKLPLILITVVLWLALGDSVARNGFGDLWSLLIAVLGAASLLAITAHLITKRRKPFGDASFAGALAIERAGLRWHGRILEINNRRFVRFDRPSHLLTFAPTYATCCHPATWLSIAAVINNSDYRGTQRGPKRSHRGQAALPAFAQGKTPDR